MGNGEKFTHTNEYHVLVIPNGNAKLFTML